MKKVTKGGETDVGKGKKRILNAKGRGGKKRETHRGKVGRG